MLYETLKVVRKDVYKSVVTGKKYVEVNPNLYEEIGSGNRREPIFFGTGELRYVGNKPLIRVFKLKKVL